MSDDNATEVLYVGGIDETIDEKSLYDIFSSFGDVRNIEVPINFVTSKRAELKAGDRDILFLSPLAIMNV